MLLVYGNVLGVLRDALRFIEGGGYASLDRDGNSPVIREFPACFLSDQAREALSCAECPLVEFAPPAGRSRPSPCCAIPVGPDGETVEQVAARGDRSHFERVVSEWLKSTIVRVEHAQKALTTVRARSARALRSRQVLIVAGDDGMPTVLKHLLEGEGYGVIAAANGRGGLRDLGRRVFDVVLVDDYLPDISTDVFLRQACRLEQTAPVLLMQNGPLPGKMALRYAELGVRFFVGKHNPKQVAAVVADCLQASTPAATECGRFGRERERA